MFNAFTRLIFAILVIISFFPFCLIAQNIISGSVKDKSTGEALFNANIIVKGTTTGSVTDFDGKFSFETDKPYPVTVIVSYIGYVNEEVVVKNNNAVAIKLSADEVILKNVEVVGSRISEKQKESPLTVEAMDMIAIKQTPNSNFYEGLGQLKGVDLTSASMSFKIVNTRGFNSTSPVRSLQLIDGVDNQSPGLNFSLGNFLGCSELDVQKVELIVGASSAYYGPNAFNGVIAMITRSPFIKPGLEVSYKVGERNLTETAFRWAEFFKNKKGEPKFGYKINMCFFKANDWEANNFSPTPQSHNDPNNPGRYDAVNIYGDEFNSNGDYSLNQKQFPGLGTFYRKGYKESDLVDYNTKNIKLGGAFHYKLQPQTEIILASNFGTGTTVYQGDNRYSLKDILFFQNRVEIRKENKFFLRAYATHEDAGKSYDAYFTALLLQEKAKTDSRWYQDYYNFWSTSVSNNLSGLPGFPQPPVYNPLDSVGYSAAYQAYTTSINPFLLANYYDTLLYYHDTSLAVANSPDFINSGLAYIEPGTYEFDTAFASIISKKSYGEGGSKFFDKSALYHVQGEYKFTTKLVDITIGSNLRIYAPYSEGTIFSDTLEIKYHMDETTGDTVSIDTGYVRIRNHEYGFYAGLEKKLFKEKLKINLTARVDKNENFDYNFSPAASLVYNFDKNNIGRVSFSSAIRNPTLTDQYLYYQVGRATLIGNTKGYDSLVTIPSLLSYYTWSFAPGIEALDSLQFFNLDPARPEKVKTIEAGYRTSLLNHLYLDVNYYHSWYQYFIGYKIGATVDIVKIPGIFDTSTYVYLKDVYRAATNSLDEVTTQGASVGLSYFFWKNYELTGNYSWNKLDRRGSTDPLIPAYNTPEHKYNAGINGRDIKNWGFSINYKWVEGFLFEGSPQFTGRIETYNMLDVQINKRIPAIYTTFKLGANNVLNNMHYEVYGGPLVGRLIYFSILLELNDGK